jgi:SNARE associated Golgi protein
VRAGDAIHHGVWIIVVARFIPGGRTATTYAAGTVGMPWRRFLPADAIAVALWALYVRARLHRRRHVPGQPVAPRLDPCDRRCPPVTACDGCA